MQIVTVVTDPTSQRPVLHAGGKTPKVPALFKGHTHSMLHFNQIPGHVPLFSLPLSSYSICTLHLHLRFIAMLWSHSVLRDPELSKKIKGRRGKGADDGTLAAWIWVVLHKIGVHVKLPSSPAKDANKYFHSISKHSFHGRDASHLLTVWRRILRMVYSEEACAKNPATQIKYDRWVACWQFYEETLLPLLYLETDDSTTQREAKATAVEREGRNFLKLWNEATEGGTSHVYPHILICHLPDMIRFLLVDPMHLELQSMESSHAVGKKIAHKTNKQAPREEEEDLVWIEEYFKQYKKQGLVKMKGHWRNAGRRRVFQIMKKKLLLKTVDKQYDTAASLVIKHQKWLAARVKRHATQARWKSKTRGKDLPLFAAEAAEVVSDSDAEVVDLPSSEATPSHGSDSESSIAERTDDEDESEEVVIAKRQKRVSKK